MDVTFQTGFNIVVAILGFGLGVFMTRLFASLDALRAQDEKLTEEITKIKIALPTNYVTKPDMDAIAIVIFKKLDIITAKLDGKMDKVGAV